MRRKKYGQKNTAKKIRSDQPVSRILYPCTVTRCRGNDHSSRMHVAVHLKQPTRKLGRAALKRFSIWSCTGRGLPSFSSHLENWCALTAPFHPYRTPQGVPGGLFSAALSFTLLRLHVMERPALRCSDFPRNLSIPRSSSLVRPYAFLSESFCPSF